MAQHFRLSAESRTLSLKEIYKGGEDKAKMMFRKLRWPETNGEPECPKCECERYYDVPSRSRFKCAACGHQYSVTSGTIFASRKMDFTDLLAAITLVINGAKGLSMVQLSRDLDCQYKTAFVLAHKLREAMAMDIHTGEELNGVVEIDGQYHGGHVRPHNWKRDRVDRRRAENQTGTRRVVVAMRERVGRTLPFVTRNEADGVALAVENVARTATMAADEASHWDTLHDGWEVERVNHSEVYSDHGKNTNMVESFFSRLRRMVQGQHHHVSPQYLYQYANHAAWLEDHRGESNGELAARVVGNAMKSSVSRQWKGYWQRGKITA